MRRRTDWRRTFRQVGDDEGRAVHDRVTEISADAELGGDPTCRETEDGPWCPQREKASEIVTSRAAGRAGRGHDRPRTVDLTRRCNRQWTHVRSDRWHDKAELSGAHTQADTLFKRARRSHHGVVEELDEVVGDVKPRGSVDVAGHR